VPGGPGGAGRPPTPRRLRRLSERPLPWAIAAVGGFLAAVLGAYLLIKVIQDRGGASGRGAFWLITFLGVLGLALAMSTFLYTFRKRSRRLQESSRFTMMTWFKAHIWVGLLAFGVIVAHVLTRPITTNLSTGKLALIVFAVLVASGVAWRIVYRTVPPNVARGPRNLAVVDTEQRIEEIQSQIEKLAAGKSAMFQSLVQARLHGPPPATLDPQAATLPDHERTAWVELNTLAYNREGYGKREERQRHYAKWLQRWKLLHIPLAAIFLGLVVVHIADVFGAGRAAFGGRAAQFPNSKACANCHADITRQWRSSVMSHGVTSPFMVAQTALAVRENANANLALGQLCVNCHGPIGAAITGSATLPFPGTVNSTDPGDTGSHDLVLAEGVSCVVCHALDAAPGVGEGSAPFHPNESGLTSLGSFAGPNQSNPDPVPVPDHRIREGGYMGDQFASSQLCGACHVVQVDLDGGGVDRFAKDQGDLVLQTTFLEWGDEYLSTFGGDLSGARGCVSCHAPGGTAALVSSAPFGQSAPTRTVRDHTFPGVDYDLTPGHPGLSDDQFAAQLAETETLLKSAAQVNVSASVQPDANGNNFLTAEVSVSNLGAGHTLPTGFAFVRQMWLEVAANQVNADGSVGDPVCLANVRFGRKVLSSQCASGHIDSPQQDLPYCDVVQLARDFKAFRSDDATIQLAPGASQPAGSCDPWLASWQKILTDGPPDGNKLRHEVAYQSLLPDIVANRHRVFDQIAMAPIGPPGYPGRPDPDDPKKLIEQPGTFPDIPYLFQLGDLQQGQQVVVTATLHFRHLPPYFIRSLSEFYPPGVTADGLLAALRVVDMASGQATARI